MSSSSPGQQGWTLTNDIGQVAYVIVTPFTYSGAFDEASNSPGWWIDIPGGSRIRMPLSGQVSHAGQYDRWSFTITIMQGGFSILGQGEGYSNGNFPGANTVNGTITGSAKNPGETKSSALNNTWHGNNYTVWK